jgi:hypothetical protein
VLQLCFRSHLNQRFTHKVIGPPKSQESQFWEFRDSHLGIPEQNDIWVLVPWPSIEYIIRGKVSASPKSRPWWVLWVRVCLWFVRAPKCSNYALTNLLFGLCRSVWVIDLLINFPSPILAHPFTPKVLRAKERPNSPFNCFHLWTDNWVHQGAWGCVKRFPYMKISTNIMNKPPSKHPSTLVQETFSQAPF